LLKVGIRWREWRVERDINEGERERRKKRKET